LSETKGQIKFNQYQKEVFEFMLNKLWLEPITLAELKDNNIYGRLTAFLDNNVMISRKDKKEVDYYYQFLEYMSQVQQQDYTVAMPNPFNIDQLIKNIENKTNQYVQFKQKGETLAQLTKFPAAYVSILSAQVFNDMRFEQGISGLDYTAAITDMNIKKQMDANIKSILDGIQANKDNLKKMVADTVRKNQVISVHTKFSHFDQELFDTSLYQKEDLSLIYVGK
jgi:translation initiation factor 2B subunit (eIF-2B alpha/beta/delta family)